MSNKGGNPKWPKRHQGKQECARRLRQIARRLITLAGLGLKPKEVERNNRESLAC